MQSLCNILQYLLLGLGFLIFLILNNGSIVIGDHSAHEATIHIPQLMYFSLFTIFLAWPHLISEIRPFLKVFSRHKGPFAAAIALMAFIVFMNTLEHPYLLADNRHYVFYVWKNFYRGIPLFRYLIIIVYLFGFYCIYKKLYVKTDVTYFLIYVPCVIISLVFQRLIEVRYFFIPYILFRIRLRNSNAVALFAEFAYYVLLNVLFFYVFKTKDIYWSDYKYVQKLIW